MRGEIWKRGSMKQSEGKFTGELTSRVQRRWGKHSRPDMYSVRGDRNLPKLENCVCKTQVMPPCLKPVFTPCPILTHDTQHIQSILEINVWNVKVKTAVILSKLYFWVQKNNMHTFNMLLIAVQSFNMNSCKPWEELLAQSYYLFMKPNLKIV